MKYRQFLITALVLHTVSQAQTNDAAAKELLSKMTLKEKSSLVAGTGMKASVTTNGAVGATTGKVNGAAGTTAPISRFDIPAVIMADGPLGVRIEAARPGDTNTYYCTAFPAGTLMASTWNRDLVEQVGRSIGQEAKSYGIDIMLAPGVNIQRNLLGGRNFEYYSEDPLLSGTMGASFINGIQSTGVGACAKHFAANNLENNRSNSNSILSERALREIYLKSFEVLLENSKPWTFMTAYNKINGVYCSESTELLTDILRNEWGFEGVVMTDWFGGKSATAQMKAGNDLIMPGGATKARSIANAVEDGELEPEIVDRNALRIIRMILQSLSYKKYNNDNHPDLAANAATAREAAQEGIVLVKNEKQALPFGKSTKIALFGNNSYDLNIGGMGSSEVKSTYKVNLDKGLLNAGLVLDEKLAAQYTSYMTEAKKKLPERAHLLDMPAQVPPMALTEEELKLLADQNDAAVFTIGRIAGEGQDRKIDTDFNLTAQERESLKKISAIFHSAGKKVVVVLNIDSVIEVASWRDIADGIVLAWLPGMEGGNAIADVLSGKVNPSGKLAVTFPITYKDVPSSGTFPAATEKEPVDVLYNEGIYVGYRYFDTFRITPAYDFGYGLSYTTFNYKNIKLSSKTLTDQVQISVEVHNNGAVAGKEIVQLYVAAPGKELKKPLKELRGYAKTKLLKPGEKQILTFTLKSSDLTSFDTVSASWVTEKGQYTAYLLPSALGKGMEVKFDVKDNKVIQKVEHHLVPAQPINELR